MKTKLAFATLAAVFLAQTSAFAWSTVYNGQYRATYSKWSGYPGDKEFWPCSVILNETPGKVTARVQFAQIQGPMDFAFDPAKMEHPATNDKYIDVPVNFSANTYMNYSLNAIGKFSLRLDYVKANGAIYLENAYLQDFDKTHWHCQIQSKN